MRFCIPHVVVALMAIGFDFANGFSVQSPTSLASLQRHLLPRNKSVVLQVAKAMESNDEDDSRWISERHWLTWVHKRLEEQPVGEASAVVLRQMVPAMTAWARKKSTLGAQRAESLMQRYVSESLAGNQGAALDTKLFNIIMDGWAKSRQADAPGMVGNVLQWMKQLRQEHGIDHIRPDVVSMSTLVAAWAKSGAPDAGNRAEAILEYMEKNGFNPNHITYNTVLHACATSRMADRAQRAEKLVQRMVERYESGEHEECRPDVCTYQSLISAWARSGVHGAPQKAEQVLEFLKSQHEQGDSHLEPNGHCYSAVIHAWSNSMEPQKARNAYKILQHMRKQYEQENNTLLKPNAIVFTSVINACKSPADDSEKEDAFRIAQLTMEELRYSDYGNPNFVTYAAFLNVCATTLPPGSERDKIVDNVFRQCCEAGQVGRKVLERLEEAASPELYNQLASNVMTTDEDGAQIFEPPFEWTRNVKGERYFPPKRKRNLDRSNQNSLKSSQNKARADRRDELDADTSGMKWSVATF